MAQYASFKLTTREVNEPDGNELNQAYIWKKGADTHKILAVTDQMNENAGGEDKQQPPFGAPDAFKAIWHGTHPLAAFGTWIDNLLQDPPTPFTMYNEAVKKNGGDPVDQYPKSEAEAAAPVEDEDEEEAEFDEEDEDEYEDDDFDEDEEDEYEDDDFDEDEDDGIEEMDDDAEMSDLERAARRLEGTHKTKRSKTPKAPKAAPKRPWRAASIRPKSPGPDFERFGPHNQLSHDHLHKIMGAALMPSMLELEGGEVKPPGPPAGVKIPAMKTPAAMMQEKLKLMQQIPPFGPLPPPFNLSAVPFAPYFPFPKFTPPAAAPLAAGTDGTKNARDVSIGLEELREHLGWAWDGFSGIMSYKSTIYDSRWCIARSLRDIISFAPETVPSWFIDWFYVLFVSQRAVWQMISIALLSPSAGLKHTYGLMRACMSYLTLFWQVTRRNCHHHRLLHHNCLFSHHPPSLIQAHVANTGMRLGGGGTPVWEWLSSEDMAKGIPG